MWRKNLLRSVIAALMMVYLVNLKAIRCQSVSVLLCLQEPGGESPFSLRHAL